MITIPPHISSISAPQFDVFNKLADQGRARGADVVNLGQAVPGFPPPPIAIEELARSLRDEGAHIYSAVAGEAALRDALAAWLHADAGADVQPDEMIITAGGNQAFMLALMMLLSPGDEVVLPSPYFLNHEMAVRAVGALPVEVAIPAERRFVPGWDDLAPHVTPRTRVIVLVSPANPTGAVVTRAALERIIDECRCRGLVLVMDEAYKDFVYEEAVRAGFSRPSSDRYATALAVPDWRDAVVVCGSFSKSYGITGWRCGYLVADEGVIAQALKLHDTTVICAPVPIQRAVTAILRQAPEYPRQFRAELDLRRRLLLDRLAGIPGVHPVTPGGGFFVMARVDGCSDSEALARRIVEEAQVVTVPGRFFGAAGEGYLRVCYSAVVCDRLERACARMAGVLAASA